MAEDNEQEELANEPIRKRYIETDKEGNVYEIIQTGSSVETEEGRGNIWNIGTLKPKDKKPEKAPPPPPDPPPPPEPPSGLEGPPLIPPQTGGVVKSFRNYYFVDSYHHIIANNITADERDTYNRIEINYMEQDIFSSWSTLFIKADDDIDEHHIRSTQASFRNCFGRTLAARYGAAFLKKSLGKIYKGELVIIGNPKIKPHDVIMIFDHYNDMSGPIEVSEVVHSFSLDTGFITTITPKCAISVNQFSTASTLTAISQIMVGKHLRTLQGVGLVTASATTSLTISSVGLGALVVSGAIASGTLLALAGSVALGFAALGGMHIIRKMQERQPLTFHPLMKGNVPYIAGIEGLMADGLLVHLGHEFKHWFEGIRTATAFASRGVHEIWRGITD